MTAKDRGSGKVQSITIKETGRLRWVGFSSYSAAVGSAAVVQQLWWGGGAAQVGSAAVVARRVHAVTTHEVGSHSGSLT